MNSLPAAAQARLDSLAARTSGLHTSYLSAASAAALRTTGFTPVGDVMGCATTQLSYAYVSACGYGHDVTRMSGGSGSYRQQIRGLYAKTLKRLVDEASALGADGVVGISLTVARHLQLYEVVAVGTAVSAGPRRKGAPRPDRPFTTDLPGTDLAKLLLAGWTPVTLHVAVEVGVRHDMYVAMSAGWGTRTGNVEIRSWSQVLQDTKTAARATLAAQVAATGADGCLLTDLSTQLSHAACLTYGSATDLVAQCVATGTSVARFRTSREPAPPTLSIMPVNARTARTARGARP